MGCVDKFISVVGVDLLAQAPDVHVNRIRKAFIVSPDALKYRIACHHLAFVTGEGFEQVELPRRQRYVASPTTDFACAPVDFRDRQP